MKLIDKFFNKLDRFMDYVSEKGLLVNSEETCTSQFWDKYWEEEIKSNRIDYHWFPIYRLAEHLSELIFLEDYKKVLFTGNGISQEPREFAHAGFDVTAVDISLKATKLAQDFPFTKEHLIHRFQSYEKDKLIDEVWQIAYREGGRVTFLQGDIRDKNICPGLFDLVISRKALQQYRGKVLQQQIDGLLERVTLNGLVLIGIHNSRPAYNAILEILRAKQVCLLGKDKFDHRKKVFLFFGSG
jgi:hypothetical protein